MRGHLEPCEYCKREMRGDVAPDHQLRATKDHYMPRSKRRGDDATIIVMACYTCNHLKADRFPEQWDRFMQRNPRWWEPRQPRLKGAPPVKATPLPLAHTQYILTNGTKAYRAWAAAGFPELRPLRSDEPIPVRYDCPVAQAAYEGAYQNRKHLLRIPAGHGQTPPG